jgi:hypothetical protein
VFHVESYRISQAMTTILRCRTSPVQKKNTYCTRVYVQGGSRTGFIFSFSTCDIVYLHIFLREYRVIFKISTQAEVVAYST